MKTTKTLLTIALLGAAVAQPAFARTNSNGAVANTTKAENGGSAAAAVNPDKKICAVVEAGTGSHLSKRECHTKAEWLEMGVELQEKK
jgi:hypothetical protein